MQQQRPPSSSGSAYPMNGAPPNAAGSSAASGSWGQVRKRSTSPTGNEGERPSKMARSIDLRAEEEAARRLNLGRVGTAMLGRTKETDLFGRLEMRGKLEKLAKDHNVTFTEDTLSYLALATEYRLRSLLAEAVAAQIHRTTSHHLHAPPISASGKPMWNTRITSDTTAVMDALARQNREAEQTFRANRMDRIAKETQMQRAREAREKATEEASAPAVAAETNGDSGPSTPHPEATGGDGDSPKPSGGKKKGKKGKDSNADLHHKMSNATANRATGFNSTKYSWMTNVPNIPSPLGGKKSKKKAGGDGDASDAEGKAADSGAEEGITKVKSEPGSNPNGHWAGDLGGTLGHKKSKSKLRESHKPHKSKIDITAPPRRTVLVQSPAGAEKRVGDDKALTLVDVLFALDRDGMGKGMGTADEIVRKAWAKPGGPWRYDGR